jgi:Secretion system C-terminal sorting domain
MKKILPILSVFILVFSLNGYSQSCTNTASGANCTRSGVFFGEILPNAGCGVNTSTTGYSPGTYFRIPVLAGACYTVSTCGAASDTQIGCFQSPASTGPFAYNDDNGPDCSGAAASVVMVPSFTDYALIDVREYYCQAGGVSSITVNVRQNNNLSITSSGTDMCQGETRNLTATPAAVGSAQPNSGDLGTFSGVGVSGTIFTAPAPAGNSALYSVTYTYGYCSTSQNITVWHQPSASNAGINFDAACGATTATLAGNTPVFGTGTWTVVAGSGSVTDPNLPNSGVTGLVPGTSTTFRWTITNGPCASSFSEVTINVPVGSVTTGSVSPASPVCLGTDVIFTGGGAFIYSWTGGVINGAPLTTTTPGLTTYTVTGTDLSGCTSTATVDLVVNALPTVSASSSPNDSVCVGGTFTLNGVGANTYTWSGGIVNGAPNTALTPGASTYTVTGTDVNLCSSTGTITIVRLALPSVGTTANPGTTLCSGETLTLNGTGASSYSWSNGVTNGTPFSATIPGVYTVTGTSTFGCSNTSTVTITLNTNPTIVVTASPSNVVCDGDSIVLSGSGANSYTWSGGITDGIGFPVSLATTTYTVTGTDLNGCSGTATETLTINALPNIGATVAPSATVCEGSNITLSGTGANSYVWSGGVVDASPFVISSTATYTVTGTDLNNCSNTTTQTVTVNPLPTVSFNFTTDSVCTTYGLINLTGSSPAGGTYSGTNVTGSTFDPQGLSLGSYLITYSFTDANNCTNTNTDSILVSACLSIEDWNNDDLNLFPNPTTGKFYLSLSDDVTGELAIYILDIQGKQVFQTTTSKAAFTFITEIDISESAPGIYFLNVKLVNGRSFTKRIIKH